MITVLASFSACGGDGGSVADDVRPPDLVAIADAVEESPFAETIETRDLPPLPTSHRFFEGPRGHSLGVGIAFDDPAREPQLNLHFDQTPEGAQEQFEELRMALDAGLLSGSDDARFCSATGAWVECVAVEEKYVVAARAKEETVRAASSGARHHLCPRGFLVAGTWGEAGATVSST